MQIKFLNEWKVMQGVAHGLRQPTMRCQVEILVPKDTALLRYDTILEQILGEKPVSRPVPRQGAARAGLMRLIDWSVVVQRQQKIPVSRRCFVSDGKKGSNGQVQFDIAVSHVSAQATARSLVWVRDVLAQIGDFLEQDSRKFEFDRAGLNSLRDMLKRHGETGQNRFFMCHWADELDIPARKIADRTYVFGTGACSRRTMSTLSDQTTAFGQIQARNKVSTAQILNGRGLPGAQHFRVNSEDRALQAAARLGYPVVVKPSDLDQGVGVFADIRDDDTLRDSYRKAAEHSRNIIVEKHFDGVGHRLTLQNGKLRMATKKVPAGVMGDGESTIADLVARVRATAEARATSTTAQAALLELDDEALGLLKQEGLTAQDVLDDGQFVALRRKNNAIAGGQTIMLDPREIHPDNVALCREAARALHLDIAGVDLLIPDISVSWRDSGALICEVNVQPQVGFHTAERILKGLFRGEDYRIPVQLIIADDRHLPGTGAEQWALAQEYGCVAVCGPAGIRVEGKARMIRPLSPWRQAQTLLGDDSITSLLAILPASEVLKDGLPMDRADRIELRLDDAEGARARQLRAMLKAHSDQMEFIEITKH